MKRMNFPARREQRRNEAEARAEDRAKRSDAQQIDKLNRGGYRAEKERARLTKEAK